MVFPFPLRMDRSDLRGVSGARHPAYDESIKGRHGVGFRPQADLAGAITRIPMLQKECAIETPGCAPPPPPPRSHATAQARAAAHALSPIATARARPHTHVRCCPGRRRAL